jgi:hypothetical protein
MIFQHATQPYGGIGQGSHTFEAGEFGQMSRAEVTELWKALVAGSDINNPGTAAGTGFPFRVEFLDNMLRYISYRATHVRLFTALMKEQALNTVVEYNLLEDYGEDAGGFIGEGDLPQEHDLTISRNYATIKYLATLRRVTHPMQLIRPAHGDVVRRSAEAGTLWLLRAAEKACFFGDSRVIPEEWDGIKSQMEQALGTGNLDAGSIRDLRGARLTEEEINEGVGFQMSDRNFGYPTNIHYSVAAHQNLARQLFNKERLGIAERSRRAVGGFRMDAFQSSLQPTDISLEPNVFIKEGDVPVATGVGSSAKRPAAPVLGAVTSPADPASKFYAADADTYTYKVVAVNRYGKSAPVTSGSVVVSTGDKVTFTITDGGGASGYEIHRTAAGEGGTAATAKFIIRIPKAAGATTTFDDFNDDLPGTSYAFMLQQNREAITFYQLAPMMLFPLAYIDLSRRWAQLLYGTLIVNAVRKHLLWKNVGSAAP